MSARGLPWWMRRRAAGSPAPYRAPGADARDKLAAINKRDARAAKRRAIAMKDASR
jgi:hypothetical protein